MEDKKRPVGGNEYGHLLAYAEVSMKNTFCTVDLILVNDGLCVLFIPFALENM